MVRKIIKMLESSPTMVEDSHRSGRDVYAQIGRLTERYRRLGRFASFKDGARDRPEP